MHDPTTTVETELLIVGAGPAGLFASFYAGLRGLSVTLIDSLPHLGGQVAALYPGKEIFDVAGFAAVTGADLIERLTAQARLAEPTVLLGEEAGGLDEGAHHLVVTTTGGRKIIAGAVLITAGIGRFTPRPLPALRGYTGGGIHHQVTDPADHDGQHVVIVGGGDSAVDWATMLTPYAASVTVVHRRARFRAHERAVGDLMNSAARVLTGCEITEIHGEATLKAVTVRDCSTGATERVDADAVIPALGHVASLGGLARWGLSLSGQQIEVGTDMSTGRDRIYAAGDIAAYPGKVRLIAVGFGEAATAVNNIAVRLRPGADLFPGHSTDRAPTPPPQKEAVPWPT
ncbi:Ferredoxin--NADP reductase [Actinomadura rubteroloni]|uniref:Ferredoxin--NADP reductase n=1 Tax=Actinomadura rubteroloni TaxID=1926885 RepID=A0A2P4UDP0_9ACTN|nr:NAD(P)/FAD-dependent oxidoreductase [Actinomadura rubteroloni]POM23170.1 Ferredoxin--NADP reductase [Actinomadura rubteroloni]